MYVLIYYSTYSSHNTTMLQSINFRMYPYGLNTSKTFGLLKTWYILSSFHSTLQLPGGFKGTKHCGRGQKRLAWTQNIPFFMIEPKVQFASIAIVWWCSVILCTRKKNWKDFKVNFFLVQEVFSSKKEASTYKFLHCSTALYIGSSFQNLLPR